MEMLYNPASQRWCVFLDLRLTMELLETSYQLLRINVGMDQSCRMLMFQGATHWAPIVAKSRLVGEHQSNFTVVYGNYNYGEAN